MVDSSAADQLNWQTVEGSRSSLWWTVSPSLWMDPGRPATPGQWMAPGWPMAAVRPVPCPPRHHLMSTPALPGPPSQPLQQGLCLNPWSHVERILTASECLNAQHGPAVGPARAPGMSSSYTEWPKGMSLLVRAWQNIHWRNEWQTTSLFLPWDLHEQYEKAIRYDTERWTLQVSTCPYSTGVK